MTKKTPTSRIIIGIVAIICGIFLILWLVVPFMGIQPGQSMFITAIVMAVIGLLMIVLGRRCLGPQKRGKGYMNIPPTQNRTIWILFIIGLVLLPVAVMIFISVREPEDMYLWVVALVIGITSIALIISCLADILSGLARILSVKLGKSQSPDEPGEQ
jgi:drug/metabolite transporter (DMT)-like permease